MITDSVVNEWGWFGFRDNEIDLYIEWRPRGESNDGPRFWSHNLSIEVFQQAKMHYTNLDVRFINAVKWEGTCSEVFD